MVTVLRDVGEALPAPLDRIVVGDLQTTEHDRATVGNTQTGERFDQLGLTVAFDARDADDLSFTNRETQAVEGVDSASPLHHQIECL